VEPTPPPAPFVLPSSRRRSYAGAAASIGVVLVVAVLIGVMATSARLLGQTGGTTRGSTGSGTPADPTKSTDPPSVTTSVADVTTQLEPFMTAVAPVLGTGWVTIDSGEVEPGEVPPVGAGCPTAAGATPATSAYQQMWNRPQAGSSGPGQVVLRVASFERAEDVTADLATERDLAAVVCSKASLNAYRPGTDVSSAEPLPVEVGVGSVGYRMVSSGRTGDVEAVTDVFVLGIGTLQATVTMSRCCEGWDPANEHTVLATLLRELAEAQDLTVDDAVARTADGTPLAG
jgi:hypothetical protein